MGKFLLGLIIGLLILPVLALLYVGTGQVPIAATDPPMPFEKTFAGGAVYRRIERLAPTRDISDFKTPDLVTGADAYQKNCAFCHGLPRQPAPPVAEGLFPHAPQLFTPDGTVTDDPVGVSYWKVKNGIRLTGMPSFQAALSDQQMWDVAALVTLADKLPREARDTLRPQATAPVTSSGVSAEASPAKRKK
jgi:thiosulfate dehydrogenase